MRTAVRQLLGLCLPSALRDAQLGDLEEEYLARRNAHGHHAAYLWYCWQALRSLGPALVCRLRDLQDPPRRSTRREPRMETLIQDLRYGLRAVRKSPGFTAVAVLTLGLGIGVNSSIFSIVSAIVFADMPVEEPDRMVLVWSANARQNLDREQVTPAEYFAWREQSESFAGLTAFLSTHYVLTGLGEPIRVQVIRASVNTFGVWGQEVSPGRDFLPGEERPGADRVAILAHGFWQRKLGGDPSVIGRSFLLDGAEHTVVGVASPRVEFGEMAETDLWVPLGMDAASAPRDERSMMVIGRLKEGVAVAQAREEVALISGRLAEEWPATHRNWSGHVVDFTEGLVNRSTWMVLALLGIMVGCVLAIACINVANMLLSRATSRQKEIAVRSALGAGRRRILRQLLTENVVIALGAAVLGLAIAKALQLAMVALAGHEILIRMIAVDVHVVLFTLGITVLAPLLFGLAPSLHAARTDIQQTLRDSGNFLGGGRGGLRSRGVLVAGQVALAVTLMVTSVIVARSVINLQFQEIGFDTDNMVSLELQLPKTGYEADGAVSRFYTALAERAAALPGVIGAGLTSDRPVADQAASTVVALESKTVQEDWELPRALRYHVDAGFFDTLGLPLLSGRYLSVGDTADGRPVAVVSDTAARRLWPDDDPLGRRFRIGSSTEGPWIEVVGVVGALGQTARRDSDTPQLFLPFEQYPERRMALMVRTAGAPLALAGALRQEVWNLDPELPVDDLRTLAQMHYDVMATDYILVLLFTVFAVFAVFMSAVGLYGVTSYAVSQRTREIGIRIALGAGAGEVARMVLRQGVVTVAVGTAAGMAGAWLVSSLLRTVVVDVSATDPLTYLAVPAFLALVAAAANLVPARRATCIDPVTSLRAQ